MPSSLTLWKRRLKGAVRSLRGARMVARGLASTDHPLLAHIIPIRRCNLACEYCNEFDDFSKPVPLETMFRRIDKLAVTTPEATLAAGGAWRGNPTASSLNFELNTSDAGQFLARAGYPDLVKAGKAQLKGSLAWNGHPGLIDYPSLSGEIQLQAQNGQFLEIEPGLGKLVSLMSLQSLPRRISLDFRDVFSKGFEFERIFYWSSTSRPSRREAWR